MTPLIWLGILLAFGFAVLWGVGLWQYACDTIADAFRAAWERLK